MTFQLSEEQQAIAKTAREFAAERMPIAHFRSLRDQPRGLRYSREVWQQLARVGLVGIVVPEEFGGAQLGMSEAGLVLHEFGRTLAPTPFLSTAIIGASALHLGGSLALRDRHLNAICDGRELVALAHEEASDHRPYDVSTTALPSANGFRIDGAKSFVLDGAIADHYVVVARTAGQQTNREGLSVFWVASDSTGIEVESRSMVDGRSMARVTFRNVVVQESDVLGRPGAGAELIDALLLRAQAGLSAEMLGGLEAVYARTLEYLKERKQFGVPIGSFQALQHRAAQMFCEVELTKSIVAEALRAIDDRRTDAAVYVSCAKARVSEVFVHASAEAIQMHGGIGVTDECDVGLFYKRAHVAAMTFGSAGFHRDRFGRLQGY